MPTNSNRIHNSKMNRDKRSASMELIDPFTKRVNMVSVFTAGHEYVRYLLHQPGAFFDSQKKACEKVLTQPDSSVIDVVVMPTGAGKTTVACALPYLLKSSKVLVLVPSLALKDQWERAFGLGDTGKMEDALVRVKPDAVVPNEFTHLRVETGTDITRINQSDVTILNLQKFRKRSVAELTNDLISNAVPMDQIKQLQKELENCLQSIGLQSVGGLKAALLRCDHLFSKKLEKADIYDNSVFKAQTENTLETISSTIKDLYDRLNDSVQKNAALRNALRSYGVKLQVSTMIDDARTLLQGNRLSESRYLDDDTKFYEQLDPSLYDLVLVDEGHHFPSSYHEVVEKRFAKARMIFFTATPFRGDAKDFFRIKRDVAVVYRQARSDAEKDGCIRPVDFQWVEGTDDPEENPGTLRIKKVFSTVIEACQTRRQLNQPFKAMICIGVGSTDEYVKSARQVEAQIRGVHLQLMIAGFDERTDSDVAERFRMDKEPHILLIKERLLEGYDNSNVSIVGISTRTITSPVKFFQLVGRAVRIYDYSSRDWGLHALCLLPKTPEHEKLVSAFKDDDFTELMQRNLPEGRTGVLRMFEELDEELN